MLFKECSDLWLLVTAYVKEEVLTLGIGQKAAFDCCSSQNHIIIYGECIYLYRPCPNVAHKVNV